VAPNFTESLSDVIDANKSIVVNIRHDIHRHPELSLQEFRTTEIIRSRLTASGWEILPCPTPTGAVAIFRGSRPGKRVLIRADIDALPVQEESGVPYASTVNGVMHACGHDVHTASLLSVVQALPRVGNDFAGEIVALFQPAEEGLSGAKTMIDGGLLESLPVDYVIGGHVASTAPVGFVTTKPGVMMAASRAFTIELEGPGGHGAWPTAEGNVILALSALTPRLGEVVEGLNYEQANCACSIGVVRAGSANNVAPRRATLKGTLRTFLVEQEDEARERLETLCTSIAEQFHVSCRIKWLEQYPATVNDLAVTRFAEASARRVVDDGYFPSKSPIPGSEDFSEFLNRVPGVFLFFGGAQLGTQSGMQHSPTFQVDDEAIFVMAKVLATLAIELAATSSLEV
jgi:amidohydrolase